MLGASFFVSQKSLMQKQEVLVQKQEIGQTKIDDSLPEGNWSISFGPYLKDDYVNSPVFVTSVSNKDAAVTSFNIFNNSTKDARAVRVKWMVYADENRQNVLKEGKSPYIRFFDNFVSGKGGKVKYSPISLRGFYQSFVENGKVDKDFQVELMIDEVRFADGSVWKSGDKSNYVNVKFKKPANLLVPCAMQRCKSNPNPDKRDSVFYTCESSTMREVCQNSADSSGCTSSACDRGSGGDGNLDFEMIQP